MQCFLKQQYFRSYRYTWKFQTPEPRHRLVRNPNPCRYFLSTIKKIKIDSNVKSLSVTLDDEGKQLNEIIANSSYNPAYRWYQSVQSGHLLCPDFGRLTNRADTNYLMLDTYCQ